MAEGSRGRVRFAVLRGGKHAAEDEWNSLPEATQVRFIALFDRLMTVGEIVSEDQYKKLPGTDGLWEFKRSRVRILACHKERDVVLLVIFMKGRQKLSKKDSKRAEAICAEEVGED